MAPWVNGNCRVSKCLFLLFPFLFVCFNQSVVFVAILLALPHGRRRAGAQHGLGARRYGLLLRQALLDFLLPLETQKMGLLR